MPTLVSTVELADFSDVPLDTLVQVMRAYGAAQVEITETLDSGLPRRLRLTLLVDDGYGDHTRETWESFWRHVAKTWSYKHTDYIKRGSSFFILDEDGRRWGQIRRAREAGSPRDYLGDNRLSCGVGLQLLMDDGHWAACRYEVAHGEDGEITSVVYLYLYGASVVVRVTDEMVFRPVERSYPGLM